MDEEQRGRVDVPLYAAKQYIIECQSASKAREVAEMLSPYGSIVFQTIPYVAVTVRTQTEQVSLLETLALLPNISYHEALVRHALPEEKSNPLPGDENA